ncbi:hypothetical protein C7T94_12580 [Pedobacter yulinensis]|uniref:Lipoprotein n=1 Tax=Pedobacter yulinensis TaxID=2126353 RepID=A0A2T3HLS9_9SPHI|nr:hypothetical protein [Pedobacter yulinensis]PST83402.1 hypothetical protein C7T94_12580 [Pedobacter yulinensis]
MLRNYLPFISLVFVLLSGCKKTDKPQVVPVMSVNDSFESAVSGWTADFADYPAGEETKFQLQQGYATLPAPLDASKGGFRISGMNRSDDLFMFFRKKLTGLLPNKVYQMDLEVTFATAVPSGRAGAGGAPGESVYLKAGMMPLEPQKVLNQQTGYYRMNIDKANQAVDGKDMQVIGNVTNGTTTEEYRLVKRLGSFSGSTNSKGEIWLCIGTDSGFEAMTTLYYTQVKAILYE